MFFKLLCVYSVMALGILLANAATEPESSCWNPSWKEYSSFAEFAKEVGSKFDRNDATGMGDAKDSSQSFVCMSAIFKWLKTKGSKVYWVNVKNETSGITRVFGADIAPGATRGGEIVNGKGYYIWRQGGVCKMTRFVDNSSYVIKENIQLRNDGIYGGPINKSYKLKSCEIKTIDNELCENEFLTPVQEAYVFGKWVHGMKPCKMTW